MPSFDLRDRFKAGRPGGNFVINSNRFRLHRDTGGIVVAGQSDFGYDRRRFRTANSTLNQQFVLTNGVNYNLGIGVPPNDIFIRRAWARRKSDNQITRMLLNGTAITPYTPAVLKGGVYGGDILLVQPEWPLTPGVEYHYEGFDYVQPGGARPYSFAPPGGAASLSDEASKVYGDNRMDNWTLANLPANGMASFWTCNYVAMAVAQGVTGPSVMMMGDSIEDQEWTNYGQDWDSGSFMRPSLSDPASGFIPNQSSCRYTEGAIPMFKDFFLGGTAAHTMSFYERVAAMLGQNDWPFTHLIYQHYRNNAEAGGDGSLLAQVTDAVHARTPGIKVYPVCPFPGEEGFAPNATLDPKGYTDESTAVPLTSQFGPNDQRDSMIAFIKSGGNGRFAGYLAMSDFVKGTTASWKWPRSGIGGTLKADVASGSTTTTLKLDFAPQIYDTVTIAPGGISGGSGMAFARQVYTVTNNGDGTYSVLFATGINGNYPTGTTATVTYTTDGSHPTRAYAQKCQVYFDANCKPKLFL